MVMGGKSEGEMGGNLDIDLITHQNGMDLELVANRIAQH